MLTQTNNAHTKSQLANLALGSSAAATILLPQALTKAMPQAFASIAPITAQTLPYCTGVCGNCGGSCIGSIGVAVFLSILAKMRRKTS